MGQQSLRYIFRTRCYNMRASHNVERILFILFLLIFYIVEVFFHAEKQKNNL